MIWNTQIKLLPGGHFAIVNITERVRDFVKSTEIKNGQVLVFYRHTTGAVFIGEHEPGIIADLEEMMERIAPVNHAYHHHLRNVDFNGQAHVRTALMTINVTIPIFDGEMMLGTYQEILVFDDQTDPATRYVAVQVTGELS